MNNTQKALRERYKKVHPLIFQLSINYAKTDGELFDILETIPENLPITWDQTNRKWVNVELLQIKE